MHHLKPKINKKDGKQRAGRGFSREELERAGLNSAEAKRLEIPVDKRRRTTHDQNVEAVKTYVEKKLAEAKPKENAAASKEKS